MKEFLLLMLLAVLSLPAVARDIKYPYEGQTLTYTVIDETAKTVKLKEGDDVGNAGNNVSGTLVIPSEVVDGDATYKVTEIGAWAFQECVGLISVSIPNSVTKIGYEVFYGCSGLTSVSIPNSITEIGSYAFYGCSGLTSVSIPNSITEIRYATFQECTGLTSVIVPNSVTTIGENAFAVCRGLTSVIIPNSVTKIGMWAFSDCSSLTSVYYEAEEPIEYEAMGIFSDKTYGEATLYVPEKAIEKCRVINPWKNFRKIEAHAFDGIDEVPVDFGVNASYEVFTLSGIKVGESLEGLAKGIYIVRQGAKATKVTI